MFPTKTKKVAKTSLKKCMLWAFLRIVREICWPLFSLLIGRLPDRIIRVSWHSCRFYFLMKTKLKKSELYWSSLAGKISLLQCQRMWGTEFLREIMRQWMWYWRARSGAAPSPPPPVTLEYRTLLARLLAQKNKIWRKIAIVRLNCYCVPLSAKWLQPWSWKLEFEILWTCTAELPLPT